MRKITKKETEITKIDSVSMNKINVFFKRSILKSILKLLTMNHDGFRTIKAIKNINRLFSNINVERYKDKELESYIWCIAFVSKQWLDGLVDIDLIYEAAKRSPEYDNIKGGIILESITDQRIIASPEAKMILNLINEALQYGYITSLKDEYINLLDEINLESPGAFKKLSERMFMISQSLLDIKHQTNLVSNQIYFNTSETDSIKESITTTIDSLSASSNILRTGIKRLNTLLSPGYMNGRLYVYLGLPSAGKAQPDDTMIPTPTGFKRLDELQVGDKIFNIDGKPVTVLNIFPQGIQDVYQLTFTDGRTTRCNKDHLWYTLDRINNEYIPRIRSLSEITFDFDSCFIPTNKAVEFDEQPIQTDPWELGYIIGNDIGRNISDDYIFNTKEVRMNILRGILDSRAEIINNGMTYVIRLSIYDIYGISHRLLIDSTCIILESLGIRYTKNKYRNKYILDINVPNDKIKDMFYSRRNCIDIEEDKEDIDYEYIKICNITYGGEVSQRCILVDDPLHVYLTEHFIPTHNSLILLKSALDVRKYNNNFKTKTPGMKPCVLYITMENTFTETIERIWHMCFDDSITSRNPNEAYEMLIKELGVNSNENINIKKEKDLSDLINNKDESNPNIEIEIQYHPYRSISTEDLFTIIQDLKDRNMEVCILILDYIKRIRPSVETPDNVKIELSRIVNELKALSVLCDIPVVTAHQMNRIAASTVDSAARQGKGDVTKLVGREHVGDSWEVVETGDWAAILNIEFKPGSDDKYMIFNLVKRRRIDSNESDFAKYTYIAHPFAINNGLRLLDDVKGDKILSLQSLVSDINIVGKEKTNAVPRLKNINLNDFIDDEEYEN